MHMTEAGKKFVHLVYTWTGSSFDIWIQQVFIVSEDALFKSHHFLRQKAKFFHA